MFTGGKCSKCWVLAEMAEAAETGIVWPGGGRRYSQVVQGVKLSTHSCVSGALAHSCVSISSAHNCVGAALTHSCVSGPLAYSCVSVALAHSWARERNCDILLHDKSSAGIDIERDRQLVL